MALTATKISYFNLGGKRGVIFNPDFDSVTGGEIKTGMANVEFASYSPFTSDNHGIVYSNSASASAVEDDFGSVYVDSVTSSDEGKLFVIGH